MKLKLTTTFFLWILTYSILAQTGVIKGRVYNSITNTPIAFANIVIDSVNTGTISDANGNYRLERLKPGIYNVKSSFVGFKKASFYEVIVTSVKPTILDIALTEETFTLDEVGIVLSPYSKSEESPLSKQIIGVAEILRSPGGNRDISSVIQILPGVASTLSFRNDIIVRGGAPNENRFYMDGIEVPNINHFATQGSSGGPVGMINVNFIKEVAFYTGAFPANRGNALSSIMEIKQLDANNEKFSGTFMLGSSDAGLTIEGPLSKKSTFLFSARRSYLQYLFNALSLPFLPTYNDVQFKQTVTINDKNKLTIIGLGALDDFKLNTNVNDGLTDLETIKRNQYILGNLPVNNQWNYTIGINWIHYGNNSNQQFIISRNQLDNSAKKYQNNIEQPNFLLLDYNSQETENKIRFEHTTRTNGWKLNVGAGIENAQYTNSTFNKKELNGQVILVDFDSKLVLQKYALFSQISKEFLADKLTLSMGIRTDFSDYSSEMINPIEQLSPRISASYDVAEKWSLNFNVGRFYQLPAYTVMGFRNNNNELINKKNNLKYIQADHLVGGLAFHPSKFAKITLEGFYKNYSKYPFLLGDSISLANLGADFGVIGNEAVKSISEGRSYGLELMIQQRKLGTVYGILSYTLVRSEFKDKKGIYIPSSWDNKHILNITAGKKLNRNWEIGSKFRLLGGAPYTPYNLEISSLKTVWDVTQQGVLDWNRINQKRNPLTHSLDLRVDKKWYYKNWSLNLYLDVQNVYNFKVNGEPYIDVERDNFGNPVSNPTNPLTYKTTLIKNESGTLLPSIGIMIQF